MPETARYIIRDHSGTHICSHIRIDLPNGKKNMPFEMPDGKPGLNGIKGSDLPLYGIDEALTMEGPIIVAEGEKAARALLDWSFPAVGTVTGANTIPSTSSLTPLKGRTAYLWPDNDENGLRHMTEIGEELTAMGVAWFWLDWKDAPPKGDAADLLAMEDGAMEVQAIYENPLISTSNSLPEDRLPSTSCLADIEAKSVNWIWYPYLPIGTLTSVEGAPDVGKSFLTCAIIAAVTTGRSLPGYNEPGTPANCLIFAGEDDPGTVLKPRLESLGYDPQRVFVLHGRSNGAPVTVEDLDTIEAAIDQHDAELVVIDPIQEFMTGDQNQMAAMRPQLAALRRMADKKQVAMILVRHHRKSAGPAKQMGAGSVDISANMRSTLTVVEDPENPNGSVKVVGHTKGNYSARGKSFKYSITSDPDTGSPIFAWEGWSDLSSDDMTSGSDDSLQLAKAITLLKTHITGKEMSDADLLDLCRQQGIHKNALWKAKQNLQTKARKVNDEWFVRIEARS